MASAVNDFSVDEASWHGRAHQEHIDAPLKASDVRLEWVGGIEEHIDAPCEPVDVVVLPSDVVVLPSDVVVLPSDVVFTVR